MKRTITACIAFFFPSVISVQLLRLLGYKIGKNVRIGFSILKVSSLTIQDNVRIGHFNIFLNQNISLAQNAKIGYLNFFKGPVQLILDQKAAIGNRNYITRARIGVTYGESILKLGILTKITTGHHLDLTCSISFGNYSILAGIRSQMWTHGYYHSDQGKERIRIDGEIKIGNNVYVGSGCIFNPGVKVADAAHIGGGSVISKNLEKPGMYVSQGLRFIENDIKKVKSKLQNINDEYNLVEAVYVKKINEDI
ncbi:hypothetical protein [Aquimarina sp. MMG016]|uniref:acyltransferase n=1 Tax=Aquimarina sp. MMG016 TaxID=2822690 RepID=UPI001B39EB1A|nr:hypothetical protein [Aquimarina sp. MMG016]MBQ4820084.1 hypothetical protein [Aquimarina sp. MMG016]